MKIEGHYKVPGPRALVWEQLMKPEVLQRSIPGCEKMEPNGDGSYHAEMKIGIAAVKGTYHSRIKITDAVAPEHYKMRVEGKGSGGFLKGEGTLTLNDQGAETLISYVGEAQVGGMIASVGQRLVLGASRQILSQFFTAFSKQLQQASA